MDIVTSILMWYNNLLCLHNPGAREYVPDYDPPQSHLLTLPAAGVNARNAYAPAGCALSGKFPALFGLFAPMVRTVSSFPL